ncbi:MAG: thioredoxin domain-containing protein [Flavobacteriaceae bacterium]|nr:thioredoxin domain-containing protein [Flavobacteriaceae bacterium]
MLKKFVLLLTLSVVALSCKKNKNHSKIEQNLNTNDLIHETSPYLLQHAYNPVDWKAWNDDALSLAKKENKLVVISIGYSACHWCHVMEEESFENDSVAKLMNDRFVNIKVDREERPDVDQIYVNAVTLMTGSAGWPLNVIALPDGRPIFGGTYFTKDEWLQVLERTSSLFETNPERVISYAKKLTDGVQRADLIEVSKENTPFEENSIKQIVSSLKTSLDIDLGGLKNAPKFPMPNHLSFALRYAVQFEDNQLMDYVLNTLDKMANGGLYDQIAGGFSRYSVDEKWHVPHFEKMLYDNAQLVSVYAQSYKLTKNENYKIIIEETLDFIAKEMTSKEGAFYSSIDADSKNIEGKLEEGVYYTWTIDELKTILGSDYELFREYYNINNIGLWEEGHYILYKTKSDKEFAQENSINIEVLHSKLRQWKKSLSNRRKKRNLPRLDTKSLTSWNALMIKALLDAYSTLGEKKYLNTALKNAQFLKQKQLQSNGELLHSYKDGVSSINGFSEDYALLISAYIDVYQATLDQSWLDLSKELMDYTIKHFLNNENSMFFFTSNDVKNLIARKTEVFDNVMPSSNSTQANNLFKLGHYYYDKSYTDLSKQMLNNINKDINSAPIAYTNWLELYLNFATPFYEVAISGKEANNKLKELRANYIPNTIVAGATFENNLPLLTNKFIEDKTLIYVCVNGTCKMPLEQVSKALKLIKKTN